MKILSPSTVMSGDSFNRLLGNMVYEWVRGDEWLYVGVSSKGFSRPLNHEIINRKENVKDTDTIKITKFETRKEAEKYELDLHNEKNPKYNLSGTKKFKPSIAVCERCGEEFSPRTMMQKFCCPKTPVSRSRSRERMARRLKF